ncbi:hypothetical protein [Streptomyces sp. NBC_00083]|uniref:hypothetical protein n=1 Tax=Streptomyces sp. NBC_00083 TaxID=2975647 RepID=UPI0022599598|nr:hypothetical protein [Streptomyces sp. NBC_00083]MCX5384086.1 hypothetical protein [Streptomyces sp. NBC_00083]
MVLPSPLCGPPAGSVARRSVLMGTAAWCLSATACSGGTKTVSPTATPTAGSPAASMGSGTTSSAPGSPTPSPAASPPTELPAAVAWHPGPGEIEPAAKLAAVRLVEALGTWPAGQAGDGAAAERAARLGVPEDSATQLAREAGSLLPSADAAVVRVIDAQYGGILSDSASVLVVCDQPSLTGSTVKRGGTTVDVRLSRSSDAWRVTTLHPAAPGPARPLTAAAREVLAQSRIELPPASVADIRSGAVHESVLRAMLQLAGTYRLSVSVVRSGHPLDVFGTDRPSDHPLGRAFDVWRINGRVVVDPATSRTLITAFMRAAAAAGSYNVGGPVQLTGGTTANQFFSDDTHHDHVHVGFSS